MIKVRIAILCENTSTEITVLSEDMDTISNYIDHVLNNDYKFIYFHDTLNSVSFFKVDKIESILLTEVVPFDTIIEEE